MTPEGINPTCITFGRSASWTNINTDWRYAIVCIIMYITEGSLEVKLPTIWTNEKQRWEESEKRRRKKIGEEKESEERRCRRAKKVEKSRNTVFFQCLGAQEGRKVGSLKRRVRSQAAIWPDQRWKIARRCGTKHISKSKCTKHQVRTTFGSWDVKKNHAVVARRTFRSQNVQSTPGPDHFWKLRCRKSARRCGGKHISKSKCTKHTRSGTLLEVEMSKKCTPLWREAHFEVKMRKTHQVRTTFGSWDVQKVHAVVARSTFRSQNVQSTPGSDHFWKLSQSTFRSQDVQSTRDSDHFWMLRCCFAWQAQGIVHLVKSEQNLRVLLAFPKTMAGVLEHQIFRFAEMILRDRCSTSYDLASLFRGRRSTSDRWTEKIAKRIGTMPSALHSTFHFWRKCRRMASFLMLSTLKHEEVSQNCFVFDVVKFKNWGSLAELLCFWCCQVQKFRKSRRIASFSACR